MYIKINVCVGYLCVCVCRIAAHTVHPIAMKLLQVVVSMPAVVLEIKKIVLACCPFPIGSHTVCPIAVKLAQVILNMFAVVWKFKKNLNLKIVLAGVPGVALQEHTPFIDCDVTFKSCCKHVRGGFGKLIYKKSMSVCLCPV